MNHYGQFPSFPPMPISKYDSNLPDGQRLGCPYIRDNGEKCLHPLIFVKSGEGFSSHFRHSIGAPTDCPEYGGEKIAGIAQSRIRGRSREVLVADSRSMEADISRRFNTLYYGDEAFCPFANAYHRSENLALQNAATEKSFSQEGIFRAAQLSSILRPFAPNLSLDMQTVLRYLQHNEFRGVRTSLCRVACNLIAKAYVHDRHVRNIVSNNRLKGYSTTRSPTPHRHSHPEVIEASESLLTDAILLVIMRWIRPLPLLKFQEIS